MLNLDASVWSDPAWGDVVGLDDEQMDAYHELHALASLIWEQQTIISAQMNNITNADAVVDWDALTIAGQMIKGLREQFNALRVKIDRANQNGVLDRFLAQYGDWVERLLQMLSVGYAVPLATLNMLANDLGSTAGNVGVNLMKGLIVPALIVVGVVMLLKQAETSRTYRKYVA